MMMVQVPIRFRPPPRPTVDKLLLAMRFRASAAIREAFPSFLPAQVHDIKDPFARKLAARIERLPVQFVTYLFFSSCLEWRYTLPLLEEAGLETWAVDILGWGFLDLEGELPLCDVAAKRDHLYQFWKSYIRRPMQLVGPSLGAAVAIDFAFHHSEAVEKLVLIDASVYSEGTGNMKTLPKVVAYAGVYLLKSIPLRFYATYLAFNGLPFNTCLDWTNVGRLHCLLPWWEEASVAFMNSGGYNVISLIEKVKQKTLIVWGEDDPIISNKVAMKLQHELPNATVLQVPDCGHIPHVEKPSIAAKLIAEFCRDDCKLEVHLASGY
ncbi:uncharacterized protein LOC127787949 isoform X3 [Diospyros lotus]|uniref:uncharacterized protein LOC127787949 isoform X3 n=1 Tax=Diospyros lotus TaxID=55363 RepID=UPI002253CADD|nr:uncharacterized protein LOC127787949 isoform X3 [Diospyros lotus]